MAPKVSGLPTNLLPQRRDLKQGPTDFGSEFGLIALVMVAGGIGMYFNNPWYTVTVFLSGLGWFLCKDLKKDLAKTMAAKQQQAQQAKHAVPGSASESAAAAASPAATLALIKSRRSIAPKDYNGTRVSKEELQQLLEAAIWAPTHNLTQPWRFVVLEGASKVQFEELTIDCVARYTVPVEKSEEAVTRLKGKATKSWPLVSHYIVLCMKRVSTASGKQNPEWEELAAVACATQNMALMATSLGLAGYWSSWQAAARDAPEMATFLGIDPAQGDKCLGVFTVGKSDRMAGYRGSRDTVDSKVTWKSQGLLV